MDVIINEKQFYASPDCVEVKLSMEAAFLKSGDGNVDGPGDEIPD